MAGTHYQIKTDGVFSIHQFARNRPDSGCGCHPVRMQGGVAESLYHPATENILDGYDCHPELDRVALVLLCVLYPG
jgi:hypothetical protein